MSPVAGIHEWLVAEGSEEAVEKYEQRWDGISFEKRTVKR